jgi:hypothetical protein
MNMSTTVQAAWSNQPTAELKTESRPGKSTCMKIRGGAPECGREVSCISVGIY